MSGNLAIAAVSAVLRYLLENPAEGTSITGVVPDLRFTSLAPHQVDDAAPTLNIFFYRAAVNPGWAQNQLPARTAQGDPAGSPCLALDLYYMVTAHGLRDYLNEVLLGFAMLAYHENPVLPRALIRTALSSTSLVTSDTTAGMLAAIAAAGLADQVESIKIAPAYPTPDEIANLWGALNGAYSPTAYYQVTVVLIESTRPARAALPVQAYNVYAVPFKHPRIQDVIAEGGLGLPILAGAQVILRGFALRGENTHVIVGGVDLSGSDLEVSNEQIVFTLPGGLLAGINGVQVAHLLEIGTPPEEHRGIESNVAAFVLQPRITDDGAGNYDIAILPETADDPRRLQIDLDPPVGSQQRATVFLNELSAPANRPAFSFSFQAQTRDPDDPPTARLVFPIPGAPSGTYLVRVRVDGADSPLVYTAPTGYTDPSVTLP
jgi:hypothetical protein